MTGKEIIYEMYQHGKADRIPWVPFAGVHAGKLKGYNAIEVLTEEEKLFDALMEVNRIYAPDGQPVVFDLQIEAEILGCELMWEEFSPPSVISHPLEEEEKIPCLCRLPKKEDGRIPLVLNVMKRLKQAVGDKTALYGLFCGPLTLASHLRGSMVFMDMMDNPDYVKDLLGFCTECSKVMIDYYCEAGMDVIAPVDPLVSQISPEHFYEFLNKPYTDIMKYTHDCGVFSSFFVCGNATLNIEEMCKTGPQAIFVDENVDMSEVKGLTNASGIILGGNIPLTSIMLHGTQQDNMKYVIEELIDKLTRDRLIIAPGCDMPYGIPIENTVAVQQAIKQTEVSREMIKNYQAAEEDIEVDIPDYGALKKPLMEVFTLDSSTCAACTYMLEAAKVAKKEFGERIDMVEYKYTEKENIARCKKMQVKKLPSIYINGELKFSSIIPNKKELADAVEESIRALAE